AKKVNLCVLSAIPCPPSRTAIHPFHLLVLASCGRPLGQHRECFGLALHGSASFDTRHAYFAAGTGQPQSTSSSLRFFVSMRNHQVKAAPSKEVPIRIVSKRPVPML